ncbi:MAG: hypothetical protein CL917_08645 [Deltaproteobacteria bacterium]|nr:hypothetical protein [Deltaproteobacteria bacterium]
MSKRTNRMSKWNVLPAAAALLTLSGGMSASAAELESERLDGSVMLSTHGAEGSCGEGDCKEGDCKEGDCGDGGCNAEDSSK